MVSTPLALLALAASVLAAPAPVPAPVGGICATCPMNVTNPAALDAEGKPTVYWLVNRSNSGQGTPTYCGYNVDKSHPWYQVFCFYANNGDGNSSNLYTTSDGFTGCPETSGLGTC